MIKIAVLNGEKAFEERQVLVMFMKYDPRFDAVQADLRFQALVSRLKLPEKTK